MTGNYQYLFYIALTFLIFVVLPPMCYSATLSFPIRFFTFPGEVLLIFFLLVTGPEAALYIAVLDAVYTFVQLLFVFFTVFFEIFLIPMVLLAPLNMVIAVIVYASYFFLVYN